MPESEDKISERVKRLEERSREDRKLFRIIGERLQGIDMRISSLFNNSSIFFEKQRADLNNWKENLDTKINNKIYKSVMSVLNLRWASLLAIIGVIAILIASQTGLFLYIGNKTSDLSNQIQSLQKKDTGVKK